MMTLSQSKTFGIVLTITYKHGHDGLVSISDYDYSSQLQTSVFLIQLSF